MYSLWMVLVAARDQPQSFPSCYCPALATAKAVLCFSHCQNHLAPAGKGTELSLVLPTVQTFPGYPMSRSQAGLVFPHTKVSASDISMPSHSCPLPMEQLLQTHRASLRPVWVSLQKK